jgi:hypothetical protein
MAKETFAPKKHDASSAGKKRFYSGEQEIDHDLFKLEIATMKKNVSFTDVPDYEKIEHVHMFHTVDSNGKKQETCSPVGGHFHMVEVLSERDGVPALKISPPMKYVTQRKNGRKVRVAILLTDEDPDGDTHTHTVRYLKSEKIVLRQANAEFATYEGRINSIQNPSIDGIVSG